MVAVSVERGELLVLSGAAERLGYELLSLVREDHPVARPVARLG